MIQDPPATAPNKTHFDGTFRPPLFDLSAAPIRVGGQGTVDVTSEGIRVSGSKASGGLINLMMLAPVGIGLSWYVLHKFSQWGVSAGDIFLTGGLTAVGMFACLFIVAGMILRPLVFKWKSVSHTFEWRDIQTIYPPAKSGKPLIVCVLDNYKKRRIHFTSKGPSYELEAAITQHPSYQPIDVLY